MSRNSPVLLLPFMLAQLAWRRQFLLAYPAPRAIGAVPGVLSWGPGEPSFLERWSTYSVFLYHGQRKSNQPQFLALLSIQERLQESQLLLISGGRKPRRTAFSFTPLCPRTKLACSGVLPRLTDSSHAESLHLRGDGRHEGDGSQTLELHPTAADVYGWTRYAQLLSTFHVATRMNQLSSWGNGPFGHTGRKQLSWDSNPGTWSPEPTP